MKIEMFDKTDNEPILRVRLFANLVGGVTLCAVDEHGNPLAGGKLLSIYSSGTIHRHHCVNFDDVRRMLKLDSVGRMLVD